MLNTPWKSALTVTTLEHRDCPSGSGNGSCEGSVGVLLPPPPPPPSGGGGIVIIIGPSSTSGGCMMTVNSLYA